MANEKLPKGKKEAAKAVSWTHYEDDPHDSWDKEAFEATLKTDKKSELTEEDILADGWIKKVSEVPKSESKSTKEINKKRPTKAEKEIEARTHSDSMLGPEIPGIESDLRTEEEKRLGDAWEASVSVPTKENKSLSDKELDKMMDKSAKEDVESDVSVAKEKFETAKEEWRNTRDLANALEKEYTQKYEAHVLAESKKWTTLPSRILGFQPKISDELLTLRDQTDVARADFDSAARKLLRSRDSKVAERFEHRLLPKVAAILPQVYQQRLEIQKRAVNEAWGESKYLRPTLETIGRHKKTVLFPMLLGAAVLNPVGLAAGLGVGLGGKRLLDKTYVASSRKQLEKARANIGQDYFSRSYHDLNAEMEHLTFNTDAREKRAKVFATAAGVAAGIGATGYYSGVDDTPYVDVDINKVPPDHADIVPQTETPSVTPDAISPVTPEPITPVPPETATPVVPEAIAPVEPALKQMGDASVAEAMQPQVEAAIHDTESGVRPEPEFKQPSDIIPRAEVVDVKSHTVVKGDNVWNILEGKGPDANPVGGKSEVLQDMSLSDRQAALDKLVEYYETHSKEAETAGVIKSGGDIHKIYPGEELNISILDDKLRELLGIENGLPENSTDSTTTESVPETQLSKSPVTPDVASELPTDINDLTLQQLVDLTAQALKADPQALAQVEALGHDGGSLRDLISSLDLRSGDVNYDMTIGEYLNNSERVADNFAPSENSNIPDVTPYGFDQPTPNSDTVVRDASTPAVEAVTGEALLDYVKSVEQPKNGIFDSLFGLGKPSVAGTFEQMQGLTVGEIKEMIQTDTLPEGVSETAFDRWATELKNVVANDNERFGDVVVRLANSRVA